MMYQIVCIGSLRRWCKRIYNCCERSVFTHMNEPLLYVTETEIPTETILALEKRNGNASIYVVGPESVISNDVINELGQYGKSNSTLVAIHLLKFQSNLRSFRNPQTDFGWGTNHPWTWYCVYTNFYSGNLQSLLHHLHI
ncbi:hypothetical protein KHA80_21380 [Anaerobacillus sp. HL2]|nr:hypothetical protein KHA80_21380 [Anaerobacillus sp. HL2]